MRCAAAVRQAESGSADMPSPPRRDTRERELLSAYGQLGDANEVLNERAVAVMKRMSDKLTGRDFLQAIPPCCASSCQHNVYHHERGPFTPALHAHGCRAAAVQLQNKWLDTTSCM